MKSLIEESNFEQGLDTSKYYSLLIRLFRHFSSKRDERIRHFMAPEGQESNRPWPTCVRARAMTLYRGGE